MATKPYGTGVVGISQRLLHLTHGAVPITLYNLVFFYILLSALAACWTILSH